MSKITNVLNKIIEVFLMALLVFMVLMATWQVFSRYVLNSPSTISEELLKYCLIWLSMIGAAYMFGRREHMSMTFFVEKFNDKIRHNLSILSELIIIVFAIAVLVYGGVNIVGLTMGQQSAALGIPVGYVYTVLPLSGVMMVIYCIENIIKLSKENKSQLENNIKKAV